MEGVGASANPNDGPSSSWLEPEVSADESAAAGRMCPQAAESDSAMPLGKVQINSCPYP